MTQTLSAPQTVGAPRYDMYMAIHKTLRDIEAALKTSIPPQEMAIITRFDLHCLLGARLTKHHGDFAIGAHIGEQRAGLLGRDKNDHAITGDAAAKCFG